MCPMLWILANFIMKNFKGIALRILIQTPLFTLVSTVRASLWDPSKWWELHRKISLRQCAGRATSQEVRFCDAE